MMAPDPSWTTAVAASSTPEGIVTTARTRTRVFFAALRASATDTTPTGAGLAVALGAGVTV
jgi:hypothetical protein